MGTRGGAGQEIYRQLAKQGKEKNRDVKREKIVEKVAKEARRDSSSKKSKKKLAVGQPIGVLRAVIAYGSQDSPLSSSTIPLSHSLASCEL